MTNTLPEIVKGMLDVPGLLLEIYGDLAKPGVRQVGKALESILGLGNTILWPITWANERSRISLERNLELYRQRLSTISEDQVIAVAPEIGVPVAEKLAYVADTKLSELYVTLLAKASSAETVSKAHPSFVNIINNLSPDEAYLLELFASASANLPFVTAKHVDPGTGIFDIAGDLLIATAITDGLSFPYNVPAYLSNLEGLGLAQIHRDRWLVDTPAYDELIAYWTPFFPIEKQFSDARPRRLEFDKGAISTSSFGQLFISACHYSPES